MLDTKIKPSTRAMKENPIEKYSPFRATSWRYNRVLQLAERAKVLPCTSFDDELIREARDFFVVRKAARRDGQLAYNRAICANPGMHYAFQLFDQYDSDARKHIEARILARQSNEEIAAVSAMLPDGIDIYERLFFNVRDRLSATDWIVRQAIAPSTDSFQMTDPLKNRELTMKFFAYFAGPTALNAIITGWCGEGSEQRSPSSLADLFDKQYKFSLRRKSTEASHSFEVNKYNVMQLFDLHQRLMEAEAATAGSKDKSNIADNIIGMLNEVEWTVGSINVKQHGASTSLSDFDTMAAELRDDEMVQVQGGLMSAAKKDRIGQLKLIPARRKLEKRDDESYD